MQDLYLDTNILMEIIFQRSKARQCVKIMNQAQRFFVSSLSVHICMYYLEKDAPDLIRNFKEILEDFFVLDLNSQILQQAFQNYDLHDFEDCIQVATCMENELGNFLTLDKNLAKKYSLKLNLILA